MRATTFFLLTIMSIACSNNNIEEQTTIPPTGEAGPIPDVKVNLNGVVIAGAPTNNSIVLSVAATNGSEVTILYGVSPDLLTQKTTGSVTLDAIVEIQLRNLLPNTRYYYQTMVNEKPIGEIYSFVTRRVQGSTFSFGVQGDSHPERTREMFNEELYRINMYNVSQQQPDLYFALGDDFSIERFIDNSTVSQNNVDGVYRQQRTNFGMVGCNTSIFLVNGNHEQAARYLLDGTPNSPAVCAAIARKKFYPLPDPENGYTGNTQQIEHIGYLKDYYAFEWGDALFVTIDPYWHSEGPVDNVAGSESKPSDPWGSTIGNEQYAWLKQTLMESSAKYKFVFAHHVLGTGRGGVEQAPLYEWGGHNNRGVYQFNTFRPSWEMPIHQLMVEAGVTIFFQGHDHIFCKQELDGVVYQSCPNPADFSYTAFNADAYKSGFQLPNSGFLLVTVSASEVKVKYIRAFLPNEGQNNSVAYSYSISL